MHCTYEAAALLKTVEFAATCASRHQHVQVCAAPSSPVASRPAFQRRNQPLNLPCTCCWPPISDPSKLEALNLNPGVPRVDEETRRDFEQFKAKQAASKGCVRASTKAVSSWLHV